MDCFTVNGKAANYHSLTDSNSSDFQERIIPSYRKSHQRDDISYVRSMLGSIEWALTFLILVIVTSYGQLLHSLFP